VDAGPGAPDVTHVPLGGGAAGSPGAPETFGPERTPYEALGGAERLRALIEVFYDEMDRNEAYATIRGLHPPDLARSREKLHDFLTGWLGGPPLYVQKHGHPRLRARHAPFPIGDVERDQWLACMASALDACGVAGDLRAFLDARLAHLANFMRNR
jgi:hemoglobin